MATDQNVLHHNVLLSNYVQHWTPPQDVPWYMHDELFPIVPVDKAANAFKIINQSTFMQTGRSAVGPRGDVGVVQAYYDPEGQYTTIPYALDGVIDDLERNEADDVALYQQLATDVPMSTIQNDMELDAYTALLTPSNPGSVLGSNWETTPGDQMFDNIGSLTGNPFLYLRQKCEITMNVTGRRVNLCLMDRLVWRAFKFHPTSQAIAPVHTTPAGLQDITVEMFEKKLEDVMEKGALRICHFRYDASRGPKSQANLVPKSAIGANLILGRFDKAASRNDISATKQFAFTGDKDVIGGRSLMQQNQAGENVALSAGQSAAPISVFNYPVYTGQRGGQAVRVLTNRAFNVTRSSSIWVSYGVVDKTRTDLYGTQLQ